MIAEYGPLYLPTFFPGLLASTSDHKMACRGPVLKEATTSTNEEHEAEDNEVNKHIVISPQDFNFPDRLQNSKEYLTIFPWKCRICQIVHSV